MISDEDRSRIRHAYSGREVRADETFQVDKPLEDLYFSMVYIGEEQELVNGLSLQQIRGAIATGDKLFDAMNDGFKIVAYAGNFETSEFLLMEYLEQNNCI